MPSTHMSNTSNLGRIEDFHLDQYANKSLELGKYFRIPSLCKTSGVTRAFARLDTILLFSIFEIFSLLRFQMKYYVVRKSFCVISCKDIGNMPIKDIRNIKFKFACDFPLILAEGLNIQKMSECVVLALDICS